MPVGKPRAQALSTTSALVVWDGDPEAHYSLHYHIYDPEFLSRSESSENVLSVLGLSHCVDGLTPGCSYVFKVSNSAASAPLLLPMPAVSNGYDSSRSVLKLFVVLVNKFMWLVDLLDLFHLSVFIGQVAARTIWKTLPGM